MNGDIYREKKVTDLLSLQEGKIVDAQDYLEAWHLAIICRIQRDNDIEFIKVNYLPYHKGNRDEWISKQDVSDRIVGPFLNSESVKEKDYEPVQRSLSNLREYFKKFQSLNKNSGSSQQNDPKKKDIQDK